MRNIALSGSNVNISGDDICVSCCHAPLVLCNRGVSIVACGANGEDDIEWRAYSGGGTYKSVYRTESIIYYATSDGIRRYTTGNIFIDKLTSYNCIDVVVDTDGNIYFVHERADSRTVTKLNSSGVFQWGYDHGAFADAYAIAISLDETRIAVQGSGASPLVSLTSAGVVEWTASRSSVGPNTIDFDAFGNLYAIGGNTNVYKFTPGGVLDWTAPGSILTYANFLQGLVTDSVNVYIAREASTTVGNLYAVTVASDPSNSAVPILVWSKSTVSRCICMDSGGGLYVGNSLGTLYSIDSSTGNTDWSMTGTEVWGGLLIGTDAMHAGEKPVPLPWACGMNFVAGDLVLHNDVVYQTTTAHISCGDAVWLADTYTIGDRVYYPTQDEDSAYILENNNKTVADTDPPGTDVDWALDNDEPGEGNHWTDYWQTA